MAISVRSSDPSSGSKGFAWPVLEAGNGSYSEGMYSVEVVHKIAGRSFEIVHSVAGAALIERWIDEGKILFVCAVSAPVSAYRKVHVANTNRHMVTWTLDDLGAYPLFTPMIVCAEDMTHRVRARPDGVNTLWEGRELNLRKGSRLAVCSTFALQSGVRGLLDFVEHEEMHSGQFRVDASREGGFRFKVRLASDLFRGLQAPYVRQDPRGSNIMTHVVSAALSLLRRDFSGDDGDEGWQSYANLVALAGELENRSLAHWSDDDFEPALAATTLYPHKLPTEGLEDEA